MTKTIYLAHHLNLNDYLAVLPHNKNTEDLDLVQSSNTKGIVSSTDDENKLLPGVTH